MTVKSVAPVTHRELSQRDLFTPYRIVLIAMWLLTTVTLVLMLLSGVRATGQFRVVRSILQIGYVLILSWYLIRTGPPVAQLPDVRPFLLPKRRIGKLIPAVFVALLFGAEFLGQGILFPLLMLATILLLIVWYREISLHAILLGVAVAAVALFGGWPFYENQFLGKLEFIVFLGFAVPMFVAGGMLSKRTGLVGSQLYAGRYEKAVVSFLRGCVLFIPLGLTNAAAGSPGPWMTWVTRWWMPFSQPWFSAIVEEAWWRLFAVSLCYLMLRPSFSKQPAIAAASAMLFSAVLFGLGHAGSFQARLLNIGLLYGLPMAIVFVKRDWEHDVGAHYMINMIPTFMVFLGI